MKLLSQESTCDNGICVYEHGDVSFAYELDPRSSYSSYLERIERRRKIMSAIKACKDKDMLEGCTFEIDGVGYIYRSE